MAKVCDFIFTIFTPLKTKPQINPDTMDESRHNNLRGTKMFYENVAQQQHLTTKAKPAPIWHLAVTFVFITIMPFSFSTSHAQNYTLPLWPQGAIPNQIITGKPEIRDTTNIVRISNVQEPNIAVYLPSKQNASGKAVVICPGGGYRILAYDWEGTDIAKMLNAKGIAAIVLKYRLPSPATCIIPHKTPLLDAQRAMRLVRHNAAKWNIDPAQIGIMGFSAGGHLASTLSTHYDAGNPQSHDPVEQQSCRPDFSILMYPVVSSDPNIWHRGSFVALLGEDPTDKLLLHYSNEKQVNQQTPPAILIHSADDKSVPVQNSIRYYEALLHNNVSAEMHLYPNGGHGYSLALGRGHLATWPDRVIEWIFSLPEPQDQ
jgi:acetyl esterase/lipase